MHTAECPKINYLSSVILSSLRCSISEGKSVASKLRQTPLDPVPFPNTWIVGRQASLLASQPGWRCLYHLHLDPHNSHNITSSTFVLS
jgi:hypothetical protein